MQALIAELVDVVGTGLVKGIAALVEGKPIDEAKAAVIEHIAATRAQTKFPEFDPR